MSERELIPKAKEKVGGGMTEQWQDNETGTINIVKFPIGDIIERDSKGPAHIAAMGQVRQNVTLPDFIETDGPHPEPISKRTVECKINAAPQGHEPTTSPFTKLLRGQPAPQGDKLRECPSCRAEGVLNSGMMYVPFAFEGTAYGYYRECLRCGTRTAIRLTEVEANIAWNTRAADARIEELERELNNLSVEQIDTHGKLVDSQTKCRILIEECERLEAGLVGIASDRCKSPGLRARARKLLAGRKPHNLSVLEAEVEQYIHYNERVNLELIAAKEKIGELEHEMELQDDVADQACVNLQATLNKVRARSKKKVARIEELETELDNASASIVTMESALKAKTEEIGRLTDEVSFANIRVAKATVALAASEEKAEQYRRALRDMRHEKDLAFAEWTKLVEVHCGPSRKIAGATVDDQRGINDLTQNVVALTLKLKASEKLSEARRSMLDAILFAAAWAVVKLDWTALPGQPARFDLLHKAMLELDKAVQAVWALQRKAE